MANRTRSGAEAIARVLGVDAGFDAVACERHLGLAEAEWCTARGAELQFHEIESGDRLGDRMLDLQAGVHLQEEELACAGIDDELDGPGVVVGDVAGEGHGCFVQAITDGLGQVRCRRLFQQFLVAALRRAIARAEVNDVAMLIADHLHLDMTRTFDVPLDDDPIITERALCLGACRCQRSIELVRGAHDADALATAPSRRLHQHREADLSGGSAQVAAGGAGIVGTPATSAIDLASTLAPI